MPGLWEADTEFRRVFAMEMGPLPTLWPSLLRKQEMDLALGIS